MKRFSNVLSILFALVMSVQFFVMVSPAAMAQEAVITPTGACTRDYNSCGNAGSCVCPDNYEYDQFVGYCLIEDVDDATTRGFDARSVKSSCSIQAEPIPETCTDEENQLGYPVKCLCPGSTRYDQRFGQCVITFR